LINANCDKNKTDNEGNAAIHIAAKAGHSSIVALLIKSGCDKDFKVADMKSNLKTVTNPLRTLSLADIKEGVKESHSKTGQLAIKGKELITKAIYFHQRALSQCKDDITRAQIYSNIGLAYEELGNLQLAKEYHFSGLNLRLQIMATKRPQIAIAKSYKKIGDFCLENGELADAQKYLILALDEYEKLNNPNLEMLYCSNNLGLAIYLTGDFSTQSPISQYLKSLEIADIIFPEEEFSTMSYSSMTTSQRLRVDAICMSYNNIGLAYKALSEYSKAIYHHRICIERFESFYGDAPREDLARYIDNFGCAYYSNGEYNEAIKCHLKALIMIDTLGSPSAIVGQIIYNLAISILELGKEQSKTNQTKLQASSLKVDIGQGNSKALINKAIDLFKCTKAIFKDDLILKKK